MKAVGKQSSLRITSSPYVLSKANSKAHLPFLREVKESEKYIIIYSPSQHSFRKVFAENKEESSAELFEA